MTIAGIIKHVVDGLWLVGGIGAAADLSMGDFGPGAARPCPHEAERSHCSGLESRACRAASSSGSPTPPPR